MALDAGKKDEAKKYIKKLTIIATIITGDTGSTGACATKPITMFATMTDEGRDLTFRLMCLIVVVKTFLWPMAFMPAYGMRRRGRCKVLHDCLYNEYVDFACGAQLVSLPVHRRGHFGSMDRHVLRLVARDISLYGGLKAVGG